MSVSPSKKLLRAQAGREAKLRGAAFEEVFRWACKNSGLAVTRIPDGCKVVSGRVLGGQKLVRVKCPFDWIVSGSRAGIPLMILCDTKTTGKDAFAHSDIDHDQVEELRKHEANGILAGYVIEFRALRVVYWFPALTLMAAKGRGSLKPEGICLGSSVAFDVRRIFTPTHAPSDAHFPGRIQG